MTANIEIETDRRQNVIVIPQSALFLDKGVKKVYVMNNTSCFSGAVSEEPVLNPSCASVLNDKKELKIVDIKTGEISSSGDIEVVEGLTPNDVLIYSIKAK